MGGARQGLRSEARRRVGRRASGRVQAVVLGDALAAVAHQAGDAEVRAAAVSTLRHFKGDVKYTPKGEGTAGNVGGNKEQQQPTYVLTGPDQGTLDLIGAQTNTPVDWSAVLAAAGQKA